MGEEKDQKIVKQAAKIKIWEVAPSHAKINYYLVEWHRLGIGLAFQKDDDKAQGQDIYY